MSETEAPLRVAAIGDLHVSEQASNPYRELFAEIGEHADVLLLCGDLTNYGKPSEAEVLAADIRAATIPVLGVLGNHDYEVNKTAEVCEILTSAGMTVLNGQTVEIEGVGFTGVKGFIGGYGRGELASFGEPLIKEFVGETLNEARKLENALRSMRTERSVVVLHYSPIPETLEGEPPEIIQYLGSARLADAIDRFDHVRAVVHGHAHHGSYEGKTARGTPVYNCAQPVLTKALGRPYTILTV